MCIFDVNGECNILLRCSIEEKCKAKAERESFTESKKHLNFRSLGRSLYTWIGFKNRFDFEPKNKLI